MRVSRRLLCAAPLETRGRRDVLRRATSGTFDHLVADLLKFAANLCALDKFEPHDRSAGRRLQRQRRAAVQGQRPWGGPDRCFLRPRAAARAAGSEGSNTRSRSPAECRGRHPRLRWTPPLMQGHVPARHDRRRSGLRFALTRSIAAGSPLHRRLPRSATSGRRRRR